MMLNNSWEIRAWTAQITQVGIVQNKSAVVKKWTSQTYVNREIGHLRETQHTVVKTWQSIPRARSSNQNPCKWDTKELWDSLLLCIRYCSGFWADTPEIVSSTHQVAVLYILLLYLAHILRCKFKSTLSRLPAIAGEVNIRIPGLWFIHILCLQFLHLWCMERKLVLKATSDSWFSVAGYSS